LKGLAREARIDRSSSIRRCGVGNSDFRTSPFWRRTRASGVVGRGCPDGIGVESDTCFCARRCAPGTRAVGARGKEWLGRRTRIGPKD
jgi:hypothetical protein